MYSHGYCAVSPEAAEIRHGMHGLGVVLIGRAEHGRAKIVHGS
jgi:hypothetical protein